MYASHVAGNVSLTVPVPELPLRIPWQKVVRWFMQMSSCLHEPATVCSAEAVVSLLCSPLHVVRHLRREVLLFSYASLAP